MNCLADALDAYRRGEIDLTEFEARVAGMWPAQHQPLIYRRPTALNGPQLETDADVDDAELDGLELDGALPGEGDEVADPDPGPDAELCAEADGVFEESD